MDASLLMWDIRRNVDSAQLPPERVVVHFHVRGPRRRGQPGRPMK
jgi:hypothetical protein